MIAHDALAVFEREETDEALVERVRRGDDGAFEELYRRHSSIAVAVARRILQSSQDAEDAAAEAFTNVLSALRRDVGPRQMFRPYLLACVKNTCALRIRQRTKQACTRERSLTAVDEPADDKVVEGAVAAAAFQSLPARWQSALWMAEVQHLDAAVIAGRLGVNCTSAAALVYRARQGFTEAYLAQHLRCSGRPACAALGPKLAQYVRGTAGTMATRQVESHIEECAACASALAELTDVNSSLRSVVAPLSIVTATGASVVATSGGTASIAATGVGLGWLMKVAVIAALSAASLIVAGDGSKPFVAANDVSTVATAHRGVNVGTTSYATPTAEVHAGTLAKIDGEEPVQPALQIPAPTKVVSTSIDTASEGSLPDLDVTALPTVPTIALAAIPGLPDLTLPTIPPVQVSITVPSLPNLIGVTPAPNVQPVATPSAPPVVLPVVVSLPTLPGVSLGGS